MIKTFIPSLASMPASVLRMVSVMVSTLSFLADCVSTRISVIPCRQSSADGETQDLIEGTGCFNLALALHG
jgi:hypothetical protein